MTTTSWQGRTAVITGAASGFGLETSRLAAQKGMNVVMADVLEEPLAAAVSEIQALGAQVLPFAATCATPPRSRRWAPPRWPASARRTWCSTTRAWAPAG